MGRFYLLFVVCEIKIKNNIWWCYRYFNFIIYIYVNYVTVIYAGTNCIYVHYIKYKVVGMLQHHFPRWEKISNWETIFFVFDEKIKETKIPLVVTYNTLYSYYYKFVIFSIKFKQHSGFIFLLVCDFTCTRNINCIIICRSKYVYVELPKVSWQSVKSVDSYKYTKISLLYAL